MTVTPAARPRAATITQDGHQPEPCVIVIFGATGDLTHRKLIPALGQLAAEGRLSPRAPLVGFARRANSDAEWREDVIRTATQYARPGTEFPLDAALFKDPRYVQSTFENADGYVVLKRVCEELDKEYGTRGNRLFYLSVAPAEYGTIVQQLERAGMLQRGGDEGGNDNGNGNGNGGGWTRIVIEKPFGHDLPSARQLNAELGRYLRENQIFRIDHYLGKETVQNILAFRFGNRIWESLWNRDHVDSIQMTVAETLGVEGRGPFYESTGALRDMVANHMLQVLSLVAMEPPVSLDANAIRDEKVKVLRSIPLFTVQEAARRSVRGQYGPGVVKGQPVPGYRQEERVAPDSLTETFVALQLRIENWRWAGVPIYIRHGKRLPERSTLIAIQFKRMPRLLFGRQDRDALAPNVLLLRIQPDDGISLQFNSKVPGSGMELRPFEMDFGFSSAGKPAAEAYERLLLDAMLGQETLFIRRDEVEAAWAIVDSIRAGWQQQPPPGFPNYAAGTWGPRAATELIARRGFRWIMS